MTIKVQNKGFELPKYLPPLQHDLLKILRRDGPFTRRNLVKQFKTPRTTIYDNLVKLQKRKLVEKFSKSNGKRGRSNIYWKIKEEKL